jgi:hypothetical protein
MQAFSNQRQVAIALLVWIAVNIVLTAVVTSKQKDTSFFQLGPHANLRFLGLSIDSVEYWLLLMGFTILTQTLKIVADEVLSPWILHSVMSTAVRSQGYVESMAICEIYYAFSCLVRFVQVSVSVSQLDFVLALLLTDVLVSAYTTDRYLRSRQVELQEPLCGNHLLAQGEMSALHDQHASL